ncbi:cubilin, partial [Paramuricea clavata]
MTGSSGSFRSHKTAVSEMNPHSQYCSWLISLAETYNVLLSFKELTIPNCNDTFLRIYDGSNGTAPLLGTYCGSNASTKVVVLSSTNNLYIVSNSGSYERSAKNISTFHAQYQAKNLA